MSRLDTLLEKGKLPDPVIRFGIRRLLRERLREETRPTADAQQEALAEFIRQMDASPVAVNTAEANEQHYEVPAEFYQYCLGPHLKYSSGYWPEGTRTLGEAEETMLRLTSERAGLANGQQILELGCGWGSLSLWMARNYPASRITAVSNSNTQKTHIDGVAAREGLTNLTIITADMNDFSIGETFDRVVSVEMFEHMKNHRLLFSRIAGWLKPGGTFFMHIFTHRTLAYHFESKGENDWMSRYFFTGGMMPCDSLPLYFQEDLRLTRHWHVNGTHYGKTAEAWLLNMDRHREKILPLFEKTHGQSQARKWWNYWRIFYMSCAELWNFRNGREWLVSHYLFQKPAE